MVLCPIITSWMRSEAEEVKRHLFFISTLEQREWLASHIGQFLPTLLYWIGSKWISGPFVRGGGNRIRCPCKESNSGLQFHCLILTYDIIQRENGSRFCVKFSELVEESVHYSLHSWRLILEGCAYTLYLVLR